MTGHFAGHQYHRFGKSYWRVEGSDSDQPASGSFRRASTKHGSGKIPSPSSSVPQFIAWKQVASLGVRVSAGCKPLDLAIVRVAVAGDIDLQRSTSTATGPVTGLGFT